MIGQKLPDLQAKIVFKIYIQDISNVILLLQLQELKIVRPFKKCTTKEFKGKVVAFRNDNVALKYDIECSHCHERAYAVTCSGRGHRRKMYLQARNDVDFGLRYYCPQSGCKNSRSCFAGSYFEKSKLNVKMILQLIYCWCCNLSVQNTKFVTGCSKTTIVDWFKYMRDICSNRLLYLHTSGFKLGGVGKVVAVDEALLTRRKYNRGRVLKSQKWIFGMIDVESKIVIITFVKKRDRVTLHSEICKYVAPGSMIWSDCWKAYDGLQGLPNYNFGHGSVNHQNNFVDPATKIHTQSIEGSSSCLRRALRNKNVNTSVYGNIPSYMDEFMWRRIYQMKNIDETFTNILVHLSNWDMYGFNSN